MYNNYKKSGIIHKIIQTKILENMDKFIYSLDIVIFIESLIEKLAGSKFNIAFPVGISINDVAAHFTPDIKNNPKINDNDLIKIDFGVHINGCITDGAFSICKSGKYNRLINISEKATHIGIKHSGPDAVLGDIGKYIQEYIESKEIMIDQKRYAVKSIYDLCGHNIKPFKIHAGKAVPNVHIHYPLRMYEDEVYAIETYPTIGNGHIYKDTVCNHFMIEKYQNTSNKYINQLYKERNTLPFCPRWFDFTIPDSPIIQKYPCLRTKDKSIVSQYEKTIYIKSNNCIILN